MGGLDSTDGLVEHLCVTCIGGDSAVQLADRIKHLSPLAHTGRHGQRHWPTRCARKVIAPERRAALSGSAPPLRGPVERYLRW
jgi:hypothetical protein